MKQPDFCLQELVKIDKIYMFTVKYLSKQLLLIFNIITLK